MQAGSIQGVNTDTHILLINGQIRFSGQTYLIRTLWHVPSVSIFNWAPLLPEVSKLFVSLTYRWSGMISLASSLSMFQATFVRICQHLVFCLFVFVYCGCCCLHGSRPGLLSLFEGFGSVNSK